MEKIKDLLNENQDYIRIGKTDQGVLINYQDEIHEIKGYSFDYTGTISDIVKKVELSKEDLYILVYFLRISSYKHRIYPIGKILFSQYENNGLHLYSDYEKVTNYLNRRKKSYSVGNKIPKESLLIYSDDFLWSDRWRICRDHNQLMVYIGDLYRELDYFLGINTINICSLFYNRV